MTCTVVAICTYERRHGLKRLLSALGSLDLPPQMRDGVAVLVIDNSEAGTAYGAVQAARVEHALPIGYEHVPQKGLSNARNAALSTARKLGAARVAFIDDDEVPDPSWLRELVAQADATGAQAVVGPVDPIFATPPPLWLPAAAYASRPVVTEGYARQGYTSNVLIDLPAVDRLNLKFHPRFNQTGGEDTIFFHQLSHGGGRIAWAQDARVHEFVPPDRMRIRWVLRRWHRTGCTEAYLSALEPRTMRWRCVNFGRGIARVVAGAGRILLAMIASSWNGRHNIVASAFTLCRGSGLMASALGRDYSEYAANRYK